LESYEFDEHEESEAARKRSKPVWLMPVIGSAVLIAVAVVSFFGGVSYQKGKQPSSSEASNPDQAAPQAPGQQNGAPGPMGMGGSMGTVTAISASSISVQDTRSGTATTYSITGSTKITDNGQSASTSDIGVGDSVMVIPGTSDSSQAAQIMVNPAFPGGPGGYGQNSGSS
jgi:hypothetical protein